MRPVLRAYRGEQIEQERLGSLAPAATRTIAEGEEKNSPPKLLLAESWNNATDLTDWFMSEKLDGVRGR